MASRTAKAGMKKGKMQVYNAQGSKAVGAAEDETGEFKKGGVAKKKRDHEKLKHGGHAEGHMAMVRADKKSRHKRAMGGKTPYSSGKETSMGESKGSTNLGHEGERPAESGD